MVVAVDTFQIAVTVAFLALTAWNVLAVRRSPPELLLARMETLTKGTADTLAEFARRVVNMESDDASRAIAAEKIKREFIELLEQQDDVLERIDTKRRRIDASESRQRGKQAAAPEPQLDDIDQIRAHARSIGAMQ